MANFTLIHAKFVWTGNPEIITHVDSTWTDGLTHYRPAMPFGPREIYFRGSFKFSIVTIQRILPIWKLEIQ